MALSWKQSISYKPLPKHTSPGACSRRVRQLLQRGSAVSTKTRKKKREHWRVAEVTCPARVTMCENKVPYFVLKFFLVGYCCFWLVSTDMFYSEEEKVEEALVECVCGGKYASVVNFINFLCVFILSADFLTCVY